MNDKAPPPSAAVVQGQQRTLENALTLAIQRMELRKWCMEQALAAHTFEVRNPLEFAQAIYDFVTKPALELVQKEPQQ